MNRKTFPNTFVDSNKSISPVLVSVLQPTQLLFLLWFPLSYMRQFLHEGGHALVNLIYGARVTLFYAHPFSFVGFVRPMLGFTPEDKKSLFVLPVSMLLYSLLGLVIAHLFVPGSIADVRYHLAEEILVTAKYRPLFCLAGVLLSVIYMTLYRWIYKKLSAGLRTERVSLSWRDLSYPGLLFTISMILGIIVIY